MKEVLNRIIDRLIDWIFPKKIWVKKIENMSALEFVSLAKKSQFDITASFPIYSLFLYKDPLVRTSIHEVKYNKNTKIAKLFAEILKDSLVVELVDEISYTNFIDPIIVPIPSHKSKTKKKGFNQTVLILEELEKISDFECLEALIKIKKTKDQVGQKRDMRLFNINDSFQIKEEFKDCIRNRNIIVFDDVITSGGTLNEAKRALKQAGARRVVGFTLAH